MAWQVIGQERAVAALQAGLRSSRPAHAYLLVGPPQVGKFTLALELAKALNCSEADPPCGQCRSCQRIAQGRHADVQVITLENQESQTRKEVGIAQVRELERTVALSPYEGRWRVLIIDPADALSTEAQNAFLKTLEEPPPRVAFVLVTSRPEGLLPTVTSRCQRLELSLLPAATVEKALRERWGVDPDKAHFLARLCRGRLGWAVTAAQHEEVLTRRDGELKHISQLASASITRRFGYAADLAARFSQERQDAFATLELWLEWWRDLALVLAGYPEGATNHLPEHSQPQTLLYRLEDVLSFVKDIRATIGYLEDNVSPRLALEALMLKVPVMKKEARYSSMTRTGGAGE